MLKIIRDQCGPLGNLGFIDLVPPSVNENHVTGTRIYTLERPWVPAMTPASDLLSPPPCGRKGVSCIPPGVYRLEPHDSEDHPGTFALVNEKLWVYHHDTDVPTWRKGVARTEVLIHPANLVGQLRGCIAPGLSYGSGGYLSVTSSRDAFARLLPFLQASDTIEIVQP